MKKRQIRKSNKSIQSNNYLIVICALFILLFVTGCASYTSNNKISESISKSDQKNSNSSSLKKKKILLAAAASLEYTMKNEIIPKFEKKYPNIKIEATYDSSGKLQTQIEEGLEADIFFSAAEAQMDSLNAEGLIHTETKLDLLKNKLVLIVPSNSKLDITNFSEIIKANKIAIGDVKSVPAGQYAKEVLTNLSLWDEITKKLSYATNVTEVLTWVSEGSADAGIVYATDVATKDGIKVVANAPSGSLKENITYPIAVLKNSKRQEEAKQFLDYLTSEDARTVFEKHGFIYNLR